MEFSLNQYCQEADRKDSMQAECPKTFMLFMYYLYYVANQELCHKNIRTIDTISINILLVGYISPPPHTVTSHPPVLKSAMYIKCDSVLKEVAEL